MTDLYPVSVFLAACDVVISSSQLSPNTWKHLSESGCISSSLWCKKGSAKWVLSKIELLLELSHALLRWLTLLISVMISCCITGAWCDVWSMWPNYSSEMQFGWGQNLWSFFSPELKQITSPPPNSSTFNLFKPYNVTNLF